MMLFSNVETIRTTFGTGYVDWKNAFDTFVTSFVYSESAHAGSPHTIIVFPICMGYFIYS